jgi:hypothetical protein
MIRYPMEGRVSMIGGVRSFRRKRLMVTTTMRVNGSACSSHTCSSKGRSARQSRALKDLPGLQTARFALGRPTGVPIWRRPWG